MLDVALAEIETHLHAGGWDRGPSLFALVRAGHFTAGDPETAQRLGIDTLPDEPLDEMLAGIAWPETVDGCAVSQEIVILPPSAEAELTEADAVSRAVDHPARREARLTVGVLRDGSSAAMLRMRGAGENEDELLTGADIAPNLVAALRATLH